jgi:hypothetical protein
MRVIQERIGAAKKIQRDTVSGHGEEGGGRSSTGSRSSYKGIWPTHGPTYGGEGLDEELEGVQSTPTAESMGRRDLSGELPKYEEDGGGQEVEGGRRESTLLKDQLSLLRSLDAQQKQALNEYQSIERDAREIERYNKELGLEDARYQSIEYTKVLGTAQWIMRAIGLGAHVIGGFHLTQQKLLVHALAQLNTQPGKLEFWRAHPFRFTHRIVVCLSLTLFGGAYGLHPADFVRENAYHKLLSPTYHRPVGNQQAPNKLSKLALPDRKAIGKTWEEVRGQINLMIIAFCDFYGSNHRSHPGKMATYIENLHWDHPTLYPPARCADLYAEGLAIHFSEVLGLVTSFAASAPTDGYDLIELMESGFHSPSEPKYNKISSFVDAFSLVVTGVLTKDYPFLYLLRRVVLARWWSESNRYWRRPKSKRVRACYYPY